MSPQKKMPPVSKIPVPCVPPIHAVSPTGTLDIYSERLLNAWAEAMINGLKRNDEMFQRVLRELTTPFQLSVIMNVIVFVIGAFGFSIAMIYSVLTNQIYLGIVFGGLDVATVLTFFFASPIERLERDVGFITWVGLLYNTYWIRLTYATDPKTFQSDMQTITAEAVGSIKELLDKHKELR